MKKYKNVIIVIILLMMVSPLFALTSADDYLGVWIFKDEQGEFNPFLSTMTTITKIEDKFYVITVKHFVDGKSTIRAKTTHGFFIFESGNLVRKTNAGITTLSIDSEKEVLYDEFIGKSEIQPDREVYFRSKVEDFQQRIDYYETELE